MVDLMRKKTSAWASTLKFKSIQIDFLHIMKYTERKENQFHNALENDCNYVNCLKCWLALKRKVACFQAPLALLESIPAENSEGLLFTCVLPDFSKLSRKKVRLGKFNGMEIVWLNPNIDVMYPLQSVFLKITYIFNIIVAYEKKKVEFRSSNHFLDELKQPLPTTHKPIF